jgi:hypothetical protein
MAKINSGRAAPAKPADRQRCVRAAEPDARKRPNRFSGLIRSLPVNENEPRGLRPLRETSLVLFRVCVEAGRPTCRSRLPTISDASIAVARAAVHTTFAITRTTPLASTVAGAIATIPRSVAFMSAPAGCEEFLKRHVAVAVPIHLFEGLLCLGPNARILRSFAHGEELSKADLVIPVLVVGLKDSLRFPVSRIA